MKAIAIAIILCLLTVSLSLGAEEIKDPNQDLRSEIVIRNLIRGLFLDREQMKFILREAKKLDRLKDELKREIDNSWLRQSEHLSVLNEEVKKEVPLVDQSLATYIRLDKAFLLGLRKEYLDALGESAKAVKQQLTAKQLYIIEDFIPCLVPAKGTGRIGQAADNSGVIRLFERIRNIPEDYYNANSEKIVNKLLMKIKLRYPRLKEEELKTMSDKLFVMIDELRAMDDVKFTLTKENKAGEIKNMIKQKGVEDPEQRISFFLLNSQAIPVLEEKLS